MITQNRLKEVYSYNQNTGKFKRIKKVRGRGTVGEIMSDKNNSGYIRLPIDGGRYMAHKMVWLYIYGHIPKEIDHKNGNRNDNRLCNLRVVDRKENAKNACVRSDNQSGIAGVSYDKSRRKWVAYITVNGKMKQLGRFKNKYKAIAKRLAYATFNGFSKTHGLRSA